MLHMKVTFGGGVSGWGVTLLCKNRGGGGVQGKCYMYNKIAYLWIMDEPFVCDRSACRADALPLELCIMPHALVSFAVPF